MTRINTNVGALIAQTRLKRSYIEMQSVLEKLSTGLRINRGKDDPAGLIASESLRAEIAGVSKAIANSQRASNVIATAEGALNEVAAMLVTIQELVVEAANEGAMSEDEISANQLQVDSAIEAINRIADTTAFAGLHLLNGNLGYITSGVSESAITDLHLHSVQFGTQDYIPVTVSVIASAQKAALEFRNSQISSSITLEVRGNTGTTTLSFTSGATAEQIYLAVNTVSDSTGVVAEYINPSNHSSGVIFKSEDYGSSAFVSVKPLESGSSFETYPPGSSTAASRDEGQDVQALINGMLAYGDGLKVTLQSQGLDLEMMINEDFGTGSTSFAITGGGSKFQLGPAVNSNQQVNIGIRSIAPSTLGNAQIGYLSDIASGGRYSLISDHAREASQIVQEAVKQIAVLRGRLGAFEKNVIQTNINSLQVTLENVTASESQIRDADFAYETSRLTRAQILTQAGTSVLKIANHSPQTVLALLGG